MTRSRPEEAQIQQAPESQPVARRVPPAMPPARIGGWLVLVCASLGVAIASRVPPYQIDDAYINYRYAVNVAAGEGFTYTPGQPPVEGFSSPLWLLGLAAAARSVPREYLPWCATLGGLLGFLFIIWMMARPLADGVARRADLSQPGAGAGASRADPSMAAAGIGAGRADPSMAAAAAVSASLFALLPTAVAYSVFGLETLLFAAVVVAFAMSLAEERSRACGLIAGALALWVRPEGGWFLVAMAAQWLAMGPPARPQARRLLPAALMVALGGLALLAFRLAIFGDVLPNTYYAKTPSLASGVAYVARTFATPALAGLLACAVLGAWSGGPVRRGYLAAGIAWVAAAILEGGDWMGGGRLLLPGLALLALAAGGAASLLASGAHSPSAGSAISQSAGGGARRASAGALILATVGCEAALSWHITGTAARAYDTYRYEDQVLIDWVEESRARSIALIDIGELGFKTDVEITDLGGLTDRVIARSPGPLLGKQADLGYLFDVRAPDLVLLRLSRAPASLASIAPTDAMSIIEGRILADARLDRDYEILFLQLPAAPRRPLNARAVFLRRGVVLSAAASRFKGVLTIRR